MATGSADETISFGRRLARSLLPGDVVAFFGDLGSGKTTLIKGIAAGLGVEAVVRSPSFVVAVDYDGTRAGLPLKLVHVDLYRVRDTSELADLGFGDLLVARGIMLIEWAERAGTALPNRAVRVELNVLSGDARRIQVRFPSEPVDADGLDTDDGCG